jgi:hypothetical protein
MNMKFSLFQPFDLNNIENEGSNLLNQTYSVAMRIESFVES